MRILLTGATGLVGQGVLHECLDDPEVTNVTVLGRRSTGQSHAKLEELLVSDFANLHPVEDRLRPFDACFYCAGVLPIDISEDEFRRVTLELTVNVARTLARLNPGLIFFYISGAASDPTSHFMPLRVKGETERALDALPIRTVMLRPGGIQPVHDEHSPHPILSTLYKLGGPVMGLGVRLLPNLMTTTERVGRTMLQLLREPNPPAVVENAEINRIGQR